VSRRTSGPAGLRFSETMAGYVAFGEHDHTIGAHSGRANRTRLTVHLVIEVADLDRFWSHGRRRAKAAGSVHCEALGSRRPIERGSLDLFSTAGPLDQLMHYQLFFRDAVGHPLTLVGIKVRRPGLHVWRDTSTLFTRVLWGHVDDRQVVSSEDGIVASGILRLHPLAFLRQLTTFRASGPTFAGRVGAIGHFDAQFLGHLVQVYGGPDRSGQ
jgi:hypothetical protein